MTTKHSLFTRSLALLLAMMLVISNMSGLTITAKAAEDLLFNVIAKSVESTDALNKALSNTAALPKLAEMNVAVEGTDVPDEFGYVLADGKLELFDVGFWYPATYNVGAGHVPYTGAPIEIPEGTEYVDVVYQNIVADMGEVINYIDYVGSYVADQRAELNNVATPLSITALGMLDYDFIYEMIDAVNELTIEDLGIEAPTPEDYDIDVDFLVANGYIDAVEYFDYDQDGDQDEDDKAAIDAEIMADPAYAAAIQDAIDDAIADELAETKVEYVKILEKMLGRLVEEGNMYMEYLDRKGRPEYEDYLLVYAMLSEYANQGLYHYYQNYEYINKELKELSSVLFEILGEPDGNGYENDEVVDAMLTNMGYISDVNAADLAVMAERMDNAGNNLPGMTGIIAEVDLSDKAAVDHLFYAKRDNLPLINQVAVDSTFVTLAETLIIEIPSEDEPVEEGCTHERLVHMEAVAPACHFDGNIEYWVCYDCETVWQNAELTQLTNIKNVVLPALGGETVHVEAVEPGCENEGNIEHWYCESCEQVWQDEALTQLTNHKNVILPATHKNIVHVEAVVPTTEKEGNIEYWYCADCDIVWADEGQTQVTNHKNVILPKAEGNTPETAIEVQFVWSEDGISATATLTVQPGNWYYSAYGIGGMNLTVNGQAAELTSGMFPMAPSTFFISNTGAEAAEYVVEVAHPVGSYMNPQAIWDFSNLKVALAEGNDQGYYLSYYNYRTVGELSFAVEANADVDVILTNMSNYQMAWLSDSEDGTVSIAINPGDQINIQVVAYPDASWNYPAADVTLKGTIIYPVGSMMNPAPLAIGANSVEIAEGNMEGYFYTWTAETSGTLVLTMPEGDWTYAAHNITAGVYGDNQWSDSEPVVNPAYVLVEKGDQVQVIVNNYDPANPWNTPAGTLSFTAEYKRPVQLSFAVDGATASVGTYKIGYALTEADVLKHAEKLAAKATGHKIFQKEAFVAEYVGYVVTAKESIDVELKYEVLLDGEKVLVPADDNLISMSDLGFEVDGVFTIVVNGEEIFLDGLNAQFAIDIENGNNVIEVKDFVSRNRLHLEDLAASLNSSANAGSYEVTTNEAGEDVLIANLSLGQLSAFGQAVVDAKLGEENSSALPVKLNGKEFIYNKGGEGEYKVDMSSVVAALLQDAEFSSESLIALGENGYGELLHADMAIGAADEISTFSLKDTSAKINCKFVLNLTATPAEMAKVAKALKAARGHVWFTSGEGYLDVSVNVPEEAYELYTAYALLTGRMTKDEIVDVKNMNGLAYVEEFMNVLKNDKITGETYENTLKMLFVDRNVDKYVAAYNTLKTFVNDGSKFDYELDEKTSSVIVNLPVTDESGLSVDKLLSVIGYSVDELGSGVIATDDTIETETKITFVNEIPSFQAAIVDPSRLNDAGKYAKLQAIDLTESLTAENIQGPAAVMLFADVNGDVTFNDVTLLDLNGHKINGNVKSNKALVIMDSSIETVSGAGVTGSVTGNNIAILAGTYGTNVEARLQDGYYQDTDGAVKHALYTVTNGKVLIDSGLYRSNVDGLLPAVHCIAAQIALDTVLNYYFTGALYAQGKSGDMGKLYDVNFEDLVYLIGGKDIGYIFDEVLDLINVDALSDFNNKIIADLINIDKIAASVNNGGTIASYNFQLRPWDGAVKYVADGDYFTVEIEPSEARARKFTLSLGLDLPTDPDVTIETIGKTISIQDLLDEMARIVVTTEDVDVDYTELEVNLYQPKREGKLVKIGGDAKATLNLSFVHNTNYNRVLGAALAYFDEELTMKLVKNGCIVDLNEAMHDITIGQLFDTINKVVQNNEIPFQKIANKLELNLSKSELAKLEKAYDYFQKGVAKVMNKFDLADIAATPLSDLVDNDGRLVFDADLQPHYADAFYKGFGVEAKLGYSKVKVILTFANDHTLGEPVIENKVEATCIQEGSYDEVYYCTICGVEVSRETITTGYGEHVPGEKVTEPGKYPCQVDEVVYCVICGAELSRVTVGGILGDVNCDGWVNTMDAGLVAQYYAGTIDPEVIFHIEMAYVNEDDRVNTMDAGLIAQLYAGVIDKFPVE